MWWQQGDNEQPTKNSLIAICYTQCVRMHKIDILFTDSREKMMNLCTIIHYMILKNNF